MTQPRGGWIRTALVALCICWAIPSPRALPHLSTALKIRARHRALSVPSACVDTSPGDDDVIQESQSDSFRLATPVVAAASAALLATMRSGDLPRCWREPARVRRPLRSACHRPSSDDLPG